MYVSKYSLFSPTQISSLMCSICERPDDIRLVQYLPHISMSSFTLVIVHIYGSIIIIIIITQLFTTFLPLYVFLSTLPCASRCVRHSMLGGEILSSTCRFFYGLKFCASKGRTSVLVLLSSCRAVYIRSTDGMSSKNSLSLSLLLPFAI